MRIVIEKMKPQRTQRLAEEEKDSWFLLAPGSILSASASSAVKGIIGVEYR
jgi:hypothetical protein